jgi:AraC-like DNA-binding protein
MLAYEKIYLYRRIVKAKLFIDRHYAEKIDLNNISDQAHFSKFHFIRLFSAIYGKTPNNYLIKVRIDQAKLLLSSGCSIGETCNQVGFESPTSFASMFKREVGQSPSTFQREQLERQKAIVESPLSFVPNCFAETHGWK